jgi:flagellar biosynthetic protein FliR
VNPFSIIEITSWMLVFVRVGALLATLPFFSASNVPIRIRLALGAVVAFLVAPMLPVSELAQSGFWPLIRLLAIEAMAGLLLGFVCRLIFFAMDLAGGIVATEIGLSLPSTFNPLTASQNTAPGTILYWMGIMLLLGFDLHHWMVVAFYRSYELLPVGIAHGSEPLLQDVIQRSAGIFRIALQMTAPVMAASFVITLVFSVLGRAVPQMNVFSESYAVRTLVGLMVFGLSTTLMAHYISSSLHKLPEDFARVTRLLAT